MESSAILSALFKSRVGLVVIDELHVVKQSGREFRKHYAQLSTLRLKLGWNVQCTMVDELEGGFGGFGGVEEL